MKATALAALALLSTVACCAASDITPLGAKPGLWESSVSTEIGGKPAMPAMPQIPESALANMPPERRAQVEAMMKGRGAAGAPPMTTKVCLTAESLMGGARHRIVPLPDRQVFGRSRASFSLANRASSAAALGVVL